ASRKPSEDGSADKAGFDRERGRNDEGRTGVAEDAGPHLAVEPFDQRPRPGEAATHWHAAGPHDIDHQRQRRRDDLHEGVYGARRGRLARRPRRDDLDAVLAATAEVLVQPLEPARAA